MSAIICPNCGSALPAGTTTCPECGENLAPLLRVHYAADLAYNEGLRLARSGSLEGAITRLHEAIATAPDQRPAYVVLGKLYAQKGVWSLARWWWQQALERWPEDEALRGELAALDQREAQADERQEFFRRVRHVALVAVFIALLLVGLSASWGVMAPPVPAAPAGSPVASPVMASHASRTPTATPVASPTPANPDEGCVLLPCLLNQTATAAH